jgi:hypothetical protein
LDRWRLDRLVDNRASSRVECVAIPSNEIFGTSDGEAFRGFVLCTVKTAVSIVVKHDGGLHIFRPLTGRAALREGNNH